MSCSTQHFDSSRDPITPGLSPNRSYFSSDFPVQRVKPLFPFRHVVATPGALAAIEKSGQQPGEFLARHVSGDWGAVPPEDIKENEVSLQHGFRLLSAYHTSAGDRLWVITEADRSSICILLPEDY